MKSNVARFLRARVALVLGVVLALGAFAPTAFADPVFYCTYIFPDNTHTGITLPTSSPETQCNGSTLVFGSYKNLYINAEFACTSTAVSLATVGMTVNSDTSSHYAWSGMNITTTTETSTGSTLSNYGPVATVPCRKSGDPSHAGSSVFISIPNAFGTVFDKSIMSDDAYHGVSDIAQRDLFGIGWLPATPASINHLTFTITTSAFVDPSRIDIYEE